MSWTRVVGHALGAADDAGHDLVGDDFAARVDLHDAGHDQAIHLRTQRADVGGELDGQHGDGAVREINAGAADLGLAVDVHAGADVVSDVGDVDLEFVVSIGEFADEDGIVKIARGFAIDGDDGQVAEIAAARQFGGRNVADGNGAGFGDDRSAESGGAGGACG